MDKDIYPNMLNNDHLSGYKSFKSKVRTSVIINGNLSTSKSKEKVENLQNLLLDWYQKWKSLIFIHHKEYYEGYTHIDLVCNLMACNELPVGLDHETEWTLCNQKECSDKHYDLEEGDDRGVIKECQSIFAEYLREVSASKKLSREVNKIDCEERFFSYRAFREDGWNPNIGDLDNPIKVSVGIYEADDDLCLYYFELLCDWGEKWNNDIISHYEPMCNYISLNMTCSKKAYSAIPQYLICSTGFSR